MLAVMWVLEVVDVASGNELDELGIEPREPDGLVGVGTAPFLHAGFGHLLSNTLPFVILGLAIAFEGVKRLLAVTAIVMLVGGLGTWLFAPANTIHIGASGVVFGYAAYLIVRGIFNRSLPELAIAARGGAVPGRRAAGRAGARARACRGRATSSARSAACSPRGCSRRRPRRPRRSRCLAEGPRSAEVPLDDRPDRLGHAVLVDQALVVPRRVGLRVAAAPGGVHAEVPQRPQDRAVDERPRGVDVACGRASTCSGTRRCPARSRGAVAVGLRAELGDEQRLARIERVGAVQERPEVRGPRRAGRPPRRGTSRSTRWRRSRRGAGWRGRGRAGRAPTGGRSPIQRVGSMLADGRAAPGR